MSLFNFRRNRTTAPPNAAAAVQTESVEVLRKRAKHRLVGSAVLVLVGIVGFPLLFDTQPRPIALDIPIEIPAKNEVAPLALPVSPPRPGASQAVALAPASSARTSSTAPAPRPAASERVGAASSLGAHEEIVAEKRAIPSVPTAPSAIKKEVPISDVPPALSAHAIPAEPRLDAKAELEAKARARVKAENDARVAAEHAARAKAAAHAKAVQQHGSSAGSDDGARAKALLEGKAQKPEQKADAVPVPAAAGESRLIVQVGAFADMAKAREARLKLEHAGLKTYTQVAETAAGKRIRVRVGPFSSREEADKAASKIKALDLPASVLAL